ncbi:MAG: sigma factor-like helix-turn-helix DNA-binding protein, partial [Verrucomicrobiota bacterium]
RDRLVFQEDATLEAIQEEIQERAAGLDARTLALETCMGRLADDQRILVERVYRDGETLEAIAASLQRRANSVAVTLHRIRQALADCIRKATA